MFATCIDCLAGPTFDSEQTFEIQYLVLGFLVLVGIGMYVTNEAR